MPRVVLIWMIGGATAAVILALAAVVSGTSQFFFGRMSIFEVAFVGSLGGLVVHALRSRL